jgi:hypothetical protein
MQSQKCKQVKAQTATPNQAEDIVSYEFGTKRKKILISTLF